MKIGDINKDLVDVGTSKKQRQAILNLIDGKLDDDMEKAIDRLIAKFDVQNSEMKRIEDKIDTRFTILIWAIGILMTLMIALKFIR